MNEQAETLRNKTAKNSAIIDMHTNIEKITLPSLDKIFVTNSDGAIQPLLEVLRRALFDDA